MSLTPPEVSPVAVPGSIIGYRPVSDIAPFTYRSGMTYTALLEALRDFTVNEFFPWSQQNFSGLTDSWRDNLNTIIDAVNAALIEQNAENAQKIADALQAIAEANIIITDPVILAVLNQSGSQTVAKLNELYRVTGQRVLDAVLADGSPMLTWLDNRYENEVSFTDPAGEPRQGMDPLYLSDRADMMNGKNLYGAGDSFTQHIGDQTPALEVITSDKGMTLQNVGVSSSFWRDTAMRMVNARPAVPEDGFCVFNSGINMVVRYQAQGLYRKTEYYAMQAAILLAAVQTTLESDASGTATGNWDSYANTKLSGGLARRSTTAGAKFVWETPPFGYYFGIGYTFPNNAGATADTGKWTVGDSTVVFPGGTQAPGPTALEQAGDPNGAGLLVPWAIKMPVLSGSQQVKVDVSGAGFTLVDALFKLRDNPPTIAVVLPVRIKNGQYNITDQDLRVIRGDHRKAVAELVTAYPALRGRVVVVDPHDFGWDPNIHTLPDGLHPNNAGHRVIATAVEKTISRTRQLAPAMTSWGVDGGGVSYPLDWLSL